jgi:Flp pilus assembly protein TadD
VLFPCAIIAVLLVATNPWVLSAQDATAPVRTQYQDLHLAQQQIAEHRLTEAEATLRRILEVAPNEAHALDLLGVIRAQEQQSDQAETYFRKALAVRPDLAPAHANLGLLLQTTGRDDEALAEYEAALKLDPTQSTASHGASKVAEGLALKLSNEGHTDDALAVLARAKNVVPGSVDLLFDYGMVAMQLQRYQEAAASLESAQKEDPNDARILYGLARVRLAQQKMPEAEGLMRDYLKLRPEDATAHYGLGHILTMLLRNDEARAEFNRSIELAPQQTESYIELADIEAQAGNARRAQELYEHVLSRDPKHPAALAGMGILAYRAKAYAQADTYLQQAVTAAPQYQTAHYYRGLTLARMGRIEESKAELAVASELAAHESKPAH